MQLILQLHSIPVPVPLCHFQVIGRYYKTNVSCTLKSIEIFEFSELNSVESIEPIESIELIEDYF